MDQQVIINNEYPILKKAPQLLNIVKSSLQNGLQESDFPFVKNCSPPGKEQQENAWAGAFGSTIMEA